MSGYPKGALFSRAESALETPPPLSLKSEGYETKGSAEGKLRGKSFQEKELGQKWAASRDFDEIQIP